MTRIRKCSAGLVLVSLLTTAAAQREAGETAPQAAGIDLAVQSLKVARRFNPEVRIEDYVRMLDALAGEAGDRLKRATTPRQQLDLLGAFLYDERKFADRDALPADVFVGLDEVLDKRQWNCLGLALLYVLLGERTGLPLQMVTGPGHALVGYEKDGERLFVETTDRGKVHETLDYLRTYLPYPCATPDRFKILNSREALATIMTQSAAAAYQSGAGRQALAVLNEALGIDPNHAEAWVAIGTIQMDTGEVQRAVKAFQKAVQLDAKLPEAYGGLGNALHHVGQTKEALDAYKNLLTICADDAKGHFNYARLLYESGDLEGSIAAYRKYISLQPGDPAGYTGLAFPLEDKGDLEGAERAYRKALDLDQRQPEAWVNLGLVLAKRKQWAQAIEAHERALALRPNYGLARQGRGEALMALGKPAEALSDFAAAALAMPDEPSVAVDLAAALTATGKAKDALTVLLRLQQRRPEYADVYESLAETYEKLGDTAAAAKARDTLNRLRGVREP